MRSVDKIDDILCHLNNEVDNYSAGQPYTNIRGVEMMSRFTYETAGYYCWIKFGDEILWDSENEPREYIEETGEYEDLTTFIKKQFNNYINTLKQFRFLEVNDKDKSITKAYDAADEIVFMLELDIDDETYDKIGGIIEKYN